MRHGLGVFAGVALVGVTVSLAACSSDSDRKFSQSGGTGATDGGSGTGGVAASGGSSGKGGGGGSSGSGGGSSGTGGGGSSGTGGGSGDSGIACESGLTGCGDVCVDTDTDTSHCGRCDHDCLGGTCELGVCQPVTIEVGQHGASSVAVDATHVYWGRGATSQSGASISSKLIDGTGTPAVFAPGEHGSGITIANGQIYWSFAGALRTCPAPDCSGGPSNLASSGGTTSGDVLVAQSTNRIYFGEPSAYNTGNGGLWYVPLLGGTAQQVAGAPVNPQDIVSDGTNLYWISSSTYTTDVQNSDGEVVRMPLAGGSIVPLADGLRGDIARVAVASGAVYFGGAMIVAGAYEQGIFKLPLPNGVGSGTPPSFASLFPRGMVTDDNYLYFTADNEVYRCPHSGCATPPEVFAPGQNGVGGIAQDAVSIYWVTSGSLGAPDTAAVRRLAK